jgi:hypothetical protein
VTETQIDRDSERQRLRETETQRDRDSERKRLRETETQRDRDSERDGDSGRHYLREEEEEI